MSRLQFISFVKFGGFKKGRKKEHTAKCETSTPDIFCSVPRFLTLWSFEKLTRNEMSAIHSSWPDQVNIKVINRPKLFLALAAGRFRAVRMCEGVQTDNAGEIARLDWETQRKRTEKKQKGGKKRLKKKSKQTHAERLAPWGPKAGHGNWPRVGATSLSFFSWNMPSYIPIDCRCYHCFY